MIIIYLIVTTLLTPLTIWGFGSFWKKNPPKKINNTYGYRSGMSMKNQETWDFAHAHCSKVMRKAGIIMAIFSSFCIAILLILKLNGLITSIDIMTIQLIIIFVQVIALIMCFILTEKTLKRNFDRNGKRTTIKPN